MKNLGKKIKIASILILLPLAGCLGNSNNGSNKNTSNAEIRIVDLNGNPKPVKTYVPEENAKILSSQSQNSNQGSDANGAMTNNSQLPPATPNPQLANQQNVPPSVANSKPTNGAPVAANNQSEATVSYDMSGAQVKEIKADNITNNGQGTNKKFKLVGSKDGAKSTAISTSKGQKGLFIQIGSYSVSENAEKALHASKKISKGIIEESGDEGKKSYRVLLGPVSNQKKATNILRKAKNAGHKDAFIVK